MVYSKEAALRQTLALHLGVPASSKVLLMGVTSSLHRDYKELYQPLTSCCPRISGLLRRCDPMLDLHGLFFAFHFMSDLGQCVPSGLRIRPTYQVTISLKRWVPVLERASLLVRWSYENFLLDISKKTRCKVYRFWQCQRSVKLYLLSLKRYCCWFFPKKKN